MSLRSENPAGELFVCAVAALFAVLTPLPLKADDATPNPQAPASSFAPTPPPSYWSNRGHWNLGAQIGFALENDIPHNISHIQMLIAQPQLGLIVRDFQVRHFPVQRFEIINEGIFGNAVHPGGWLTGYAVLFRLDGKNHGRFVPFFDAGGGVQRTTLSARVPELSGTTQFSPQGGFGVQYFFRPQRAFVVEWRYMHMSNAGITQPNHGFNASMLTIGFRWLRRPVPPAG
jgi:hypothetical protein